MRIRLIKQDGVYKVQTLKWATETWSTEKQHAELEYKKIRRQLKAMPQQSQYEVIQESLQK